MYQPKDSWEGLAGAIILKAVEDYRHINGRLAKKPDDARLQEQRAEIEKFFLSSWFKVLTKLNGARLLHRLQAEMPVSEGEE